MVPDPMRARRVDAQLAELSHEETSGDTDFANRAGRIFAYPKVLGVSGFLDSDVGPTLATLEPGEWNMRCGPIPAAPGDRAATSA
jgi:hypothetical protein